MQLNGSHSGGWVGGQLAGGNNTGCWPSPGQQSSRTPPTATGLPLSQLHRSGAPPPARCAGEPTRHITTPHTPMLLPGQFCAHKPHALTHLPACPSCPQMAP